MRSACSYSATCLMVSSDLESIKKKSTVGHGYHDRVVRIMSLSIEKSKDNILLVQVEHRNYACRISR